MQFFAGIDWNLVKNKSVKTKLDFVLEDEETKATRGKQCQEMEFEEFEGEEEMEGEEESQPGFPCLTYLEILPMLA